MAGVRCHEGGAGGEFAAYPIRFWYNGNGVGDFALPNHEEFRDLTMEQMGDRFVDGENYAFVTLTDGAHRYELDCGSVQLAAGLFSGEGRICGIIQKNGPCHTGEKEPFGKDGRAMYPGRVELHLHMDGALTEAFARECLKQQGIKEPEDLAAALAAPAAVRKSGGFFKMLRHSAAHSAIRRNAGAVRL